MRLTTALLACVLFAVIGCAAGKESTAPPTNPPPPPPPPPVAGEPTSVVFASAVVIKATGKPQGCPVQLGSTCPNIWIGDDVNVSLQNNGGPGDFYIEFWGQKGEVNGNAKLAESQRVNVLTGYSATLVYRVDAVFVGGPNFSVATVKVRSRTINTDAYAQTACSKVRDFGVCP